MVHYIEMGIMEYKGGMYSNFKTKGFIPMLKNIMGRWNQNIKIDEINVHSNWKGNGNGPNGRIKRHLQQKLSILSSHPDICSQI